MCREISQESDGVVAALALVAPVKKPCGQCGQRTMLLCALPIDDAGMIHFRKPPARNKRAICVTAPRPPAWRPRGPPARPWRRTLLLSAHPPPRLRRNFLGRIRGHRHRHPRYRPHHALGSRESGVAERGGFQEKMSDIKRVGGEKSGARVRN